MDARVCVVRGRQVITVDGDEVRRAAGRSRRVVVDLGTGDGRWIYRLARAHPDWYCIGIDANAAAMRQSSWRASRKPSRGGAANVLFILAAAEAPPEALFSIADEVWVQHPWGTLKRIVQAHDLESLQHVARIGKPGATFHVTLNLLVSDLMDQGHLTDAYASAGLEIQHLDASSIAPATSWGKRLGRGAPVPVLTIEARVGLNGS